MANPSTSLFYWYRRYKVRAADMTLLQQAFVDMTRGLAEGGFGQSVLSGLEVTPGTGMQISLSSGVATSATGYLCAATGTSTASIATAPTGSLARNDLIVLRPSPADASLIPSPTDPNSTVPLYNNQQSAVVVIPGTAATAGTQVYPSALPNDVILAGVKVPASVTQITQSMIDYVKRDRIGKNAALGGLNAFDYIVSSTRKLCTHKTFAAFCGDTTVVPGSRVLVCDNESVTATLSLSIPDVSVEFLPGVTLTKSGAATGVSVAASGVHLVRGRFSGFSGASDVALAFVAGGEYGVVERARFSNCTNEVIDSGTNSGAAVVASHTEALCLRKSYP